jgi:hypothetical protein
VKQAFTSRTRLGINASHDLGTPLAGRDAGYDPEGLGGSTAHRALEDFVVNVFVKLAPTFYRFAPPGEL